jgi:CheY-like chemotaxis protein
MGRGNILCVDDDVAVLTVRKALLETEGHEVLTALSAEAALDVLATRAVGLVITDQLMKGMKRTELAAKIKTCSPQVKVLILSGLDELEGANDNADAFLSKIEPPPVLLALVRKLLNCDLAA